MTTRSRTASARTATATATASARTATAYLGNSDKGDHCSVRAEYAAPLRAMIKKFLKGDATAETGGLDTHAKHGNVDVAGWTKSRAGLGAAAGPVVSS